MKKVYAIVAIILLGALTFAALRYRSGNVAPVGAQQPATSSSPTASTTPADSHITVDETPRDVNFCGHVYKVKQIKIDGVDVVQRVAEIATRNSIPETLKVGPYGPNIDQWQTHTFKPGEVASHLCENQRRNVVGTDMTVSTGSFAGQGIFRSDVLYWVQTNGDRFVVILGTHDIYISNDYDGSMTGPIGTLAK